MAMRLKAQKMGSIKSLKETLKKGGGGSSNYIKNVPADGITVRFLTEPEEWFGYSEYYDESAKAFVPMAEGEVLPDGTRPSFRYLAIALDVETDRVIPLKLAKTAANVLILKYDKYDTMMDRNYELQRHGEGLDTTYDVTPEAPSKLNLAKYDLIDLEEVLLNARKQATGEELLSDPKSSFVDDDADDEDDEDITDEEEAESEEEGDHDYGAFDYDELFPDGEFRDDYTKEELASMSDYDISEIAAWWELDEGSTAKDILAAQGGGDDDDADDDSDDEPDDESDDDDAESEDDDEDVDEYSEDDLKAMSIRELRLIAIDLGIEHKGVHKNDLIDKIIEAAEA